MRKFVALAMAGVMCFSLAACGSSSDSAAETEAETEAAEEAEEEETEAAEEAEEETEAEEAEDTEAAAVIDVEPQTWKYACSATEGTCWADMGRDFGEMISEATGGAITVEVYAADQLTAGNQTEGIQGVIDGTIELSAHSNIIYSNFDQRLSVVSMPFIFDDYDDVDAKLDGEAGEAVGKVVEDMGMHLLGIAENGFRHVTNSVRPIESVEDMKGLKIRVAGSELLNAEYDAWGANWSNANWSEVYTGLQTGTYEGQENPLPTADGASMSEVQKYCTYWTGVYDCIFFTMNGDLYNSLSPELQEVVDECGLKAAQNQRAKEREDDQRILQEWKDKGIEITELSDEAVAGFKELSDPIYTDQKWIDAIGQELIDAFTK